ncbi:MAG: ABC transporter permease [Anaerolineae bacterium]|nr:ABC transporter permease [Anaerolineae bacterium]
MSNSTEQPLDHFSRVEDVLSDALDSEPQATTEVQTYWQVLINRLLVSRDLAILVVAVLMFLFFAVTTNFLTTSNLVNIMRSVALVGTVAVGMTYLFVAGELDLSVGANYGFLVTLMAFFVVLRGVDPWVATLIVVALGIGIGVINGWLVTRIGLRSFLTTLGMQAVLRGSANVVSGGFPISAKNTEIPFYKIIGGTFVGSPIPNLFIIMLVVMAIGGVILAKTRFGSDIYATGGDVEAARNNAINTGRVKLLCFMITGGLCGLSAALLFGRIGIAPFNTGVGFELQVIAAIIIGGVGLFGGRGTIFGSLVGTIILGMLTSGLILLGVKEFWQGVASGLVILFAAGLDLLVRRSAARMLGRTEK